MVNLYPNTVTGTLLSTTGAAVTYHDAGPIDDESIVVLIHGTGGRTGTHFFTVFPMLASRHRVIGIDLSAKGADADRLTVGDLVAQVEAVIDERAPGRAVSVVGYSLGSCVAAAYAAAHSDNVAALVLLNGWAKSDNAMRLRLQLWLQLYEAGDESALARFQLLNIYSRAFLNSIPYIGPRPWSQILQMVDEYVVGPGSAEYMRLNIEMDIADRMAEIHARTLVIGSQNDLLVPLEYSHELFGAIAGAALAEIPGGHASVTERPAHVFHLIDRFLREPQAFSGGSVITDDVVLQLNRL